LDVLVTSDPPVVERLGAVGLDDRSDAASGDRLEAIYGV